MYQIKVSLITYHDNHVSGEAILAYSDMMEGDPDPKAMDKAYKKLKGYRSR